jgi:predicted RNase H-like HicB family nuclease
MGREGAPVELATWIVAWPDDLARGMLDKYTIPDGRWIADGCRAILQSMSETLRLTIAFDEPDEEGWMVARVIEVPGAMSQGRTREEARENVIDALRLMLSPDDGDPRVVDGRNESLDLTMVA